MYANETINIAVDDKNIFAMFVIIINGINSFSFFLSDTPQNVTILVLSFYMIFNEN